MATRNEKTVRLMIPSTSGVECEIREGQDKYVLSFFQNERQIKAASIPQSRLDQDKMVDLLSDAGVEFFSFSAIFDVAELLVTTIKSEFQELSIGDEPVLTSIEEDRVSMAEEFGIIPEESYKPPKEEVIEGKPQEKRSILTIPQGDKQLTHFKMPHSQSGFATIYYTIDGNFAVVLSKGENLLIRRVYSKNDVNQDSLVDLISESGIDFLSFSAIYDSAEKIESVILHPEGIDEGSVSESTEIADIDMVEDPSSLTAGRERKLTSAPSQEEITFVDLSEFDTSKFQKAEDFDKFLRKVNEVVKQGNPLPVKELKIAHSGGVDCIILRKFDTFYLRFRSLAGKLSTPTKIEPSQDEIAKLVNKEIPQISFSYLYDASELISNTISQLASQPMDQIIINVAVGHFIKIIEDYEAKNDLKAASKITEVLLKRFRREKNSKGVLRFGKKLVAFLEQQNKSSKVIKLQSELTNDLLKIDVDTAVEFVFESINMLVEQDKHLNAANLCDLVLDFYTSEKISPDSLSTVLLLAKKQTEYYKHARLPVVMWENAVRYAMFSLKQLTQIADLSQDEKDSHLEDIVFLIDTALAVQEERKANFEIFNTLEDTTRLLKEIRDKKYYPKYISRLILTLETQGKKEKALDITLEASNALMDVETYVKACEFSNQAIKLFYELNKIEEAVEFSLDVVRGLINLKQKDAAKDYLKFVEDLILKAYQNDDAKRIEKQLTMGDLLGQLGMKDKSKSFIEAALQTIADPKKREKIVFEYVDELLDNQAALTAQEMINLELARLLETKKIKDIVKFCCQFIDKLKAYAHSDMIFEYERYIANLMLQTDYSDYELLSEFMKDMLLANETDKASFLLDQLVLIQIKNQDFTRAIDALSRFTDHLLEKTNRVDLIQKYIFETAEAYRKMGDEDGAMQLLVKYQAELLDHSVDLSQKLTDIILKEYEEKKDYKKSIEVVSKIIEKQFEAGKYQDAYIFTVQNARYIESSGSITDVIKYLNKMRDQFLEHKQFDDASKMTDLVFRFGKTHNQMKLAIQSIKEYAKIALEYENYGTAIKFALDVSNLFEEENKPNKALEFLQMIFNVTIANEKEQSMALLRKMIEIHSQKSDFKKITRKIIDPLLKQYPDVAILNLVNEVLSPSLEEYAEYTQKFYDNLIIKSSLTPEYAIGIVSLIKTVYEGALIDLGDGLVEKYSTKLVNNNFIAEANELMSIMSEKTMKPFSEVIEKNFSFIEQLVGSGIPEKAREFTDKLIQKVSSDEKYISEKNKLLPEICERFAHIVATDNPDLASEYVYLASDYLRGVNNFDEIVRVYQTLANVYSDPKRVIRTLKRGIYICSKFKANKHEAELLTALTKFYLTISSDEVLSSFQKTIEKLEELQDLDELFRITREIIESAIIYNNLDLVYKYLEYSTKLASMINHEEGVGGILVFLLNHAGGLKERENVTSIKKFIEELNIKPKKFKKEYSYLTQERTRFLSSQLAQEPQVEEISEVPPVSIVDTSSVIEEKMEVETEKDLVSQEESESELLKVIEEFKTEPESPFEKVSAKSPPVQAIQPPDKEIPSIEQGPVKFGKPDEVLEIPVREDADKQATILSDDEVTSLFSSGASSDLEATSDTQIDADLIGEFTKKSESGATLSDEEINGLFSAKKQRETKVALADSDQTRGISEEWKVDSFGRLLKKDKREPVVETTQEIIDTPRTEEISGTPDLSTLEEKYEKPAEGAFKPTQLRSLQIETAESDQAKQQLPDIESLEKALVDTEEIIPGERPTISSTELESKPSLFDEDVTSPFSSFMDALSEDETTDTKDIFGVPEVSYEEIVEPESPKPSEVKPPDLIDLFSDALSELGTITGDSGKSRKKKGK